MLRRRRRRRQGAHSLEKLTKRSKTEYRYISKTEKLIITDLFFIFASQWLRFEY